MQRFIINDNAHISVIIDSDLFLMKDFSFDEYLADNDIAALPQSRDAGVYIVEYFWNCLVILSPAAPHKHTLDMGCGMIYHAPCDVGGLSHFYIKAHPNLKWLRIPSSGIITDHPEVISLLPEKIRGHYKLNYDMEVIQGSFLHLRGGSRWDNKPAEYYNEKEEFIKKLL
jgi:hypothetical protein